MKTKITITMRHLFLMLYASLAVSILAGVLAYHFHLFHPYFWWENSPVFFAIYGFVGCIIIIIASKALGHYWLQKEEDYYEKR